MEVEEGGRIDGATVEEAGLRHLEGVYLAEIQRDGHLITPVAPDRVLLGGDHLVFVGRADLIVDLQRAPGLLAVERDQVEAIDTPSTPSSRASSARTGRWQGARWRRSTSAAATRAW